MAGIASGRRGFEESGMSGNLITEFWLKEVGFKSH